MNKVRIVTDSTADLPPEQAREYGITVVPAYVHFGNETFKDGVDISGDELYRRLATGPVHPTTSAPSPGDFQSAFAELSKDTDQIVAVTVTARMSAIHNSALLGAAALAGRCRIEVLDSKSVSMGLGLITLAAAETAREGGTMEDVVATVKGAVASTHILAMLDTLKYALRGGRLNKASSFLGSVIRVKPLITVKDGEVVPAGVVRTRSKAIDRILEFARKNTPFGDIAVMFNGSRDEAEGLAGRLQSQCSACVSQISRIGPGLGVHAGPGTLGVALRLAGKTARHDTEGPREKKLALPSLRGRRQQPSYPEME